MLYRSLIVRFLYTLISGVFFLSSCADENRIHSNYIPTDASVVVSINTESIFNSAAFDLLGNNDVFNKLSLSSISSIIQNPSSAGLKMFSTYHVFIMESSLFQTKIGAILPLNDGEDLSDYIEDNFESKVVKRAGFRMVEISENQHLAALNDQLSSAVKELMSLEEELAKMEQHRENTFVRATAQGMIIGLEGLYTGAIVSKGESLVQLVPINVPLTVEMDVSPKDIGNLVLGNEVSVKLDALPYQKHGDVTGKIVFISEDTLSESLDGEQGSFFRVRAEIVSDNLRKLPTGFRLMPGMQLSGHISVGKRVLITYFIYPIIRTIDTSFREP